MRIKHAILIFAIGFFLVLFGSLFKIEHWPNADMLMIFGTCFKAFGGVIFFWRLAVSQKAKEFLNW